ncbi:hypothetical protein IDVR_37860 [Intrasporangium sp. DVR]
MVTPRRALSLVYLAVFGLMAGQQMLNPVLPPLARELGLSELALGSVWTVGGAAVIVGSLLWGRIVTRWGHRRVLVVSLLASTLGLLGLAAVAQAGLHGRIAPPVILTLMLLSRGLVFGLAWAATPVAAQSYVVHVTTGERDRVRGMSMVGAAMGLGLAAGPAFGGLLSPSGLLVPAYVAPLLVAAVAVAVARGLSGQPVRSLNRPVAKVSPRDPRVGPYLVTGFTMHFSLATMLMTVGFVVQDRFHLDARATGSTTGLVMLAAAATLILTQVLVAPRSGWSPTRLIRGGVLVMVVGLVVVTVAPSAPILAIGAAGLGVGMGLGAPGFMTAPTLNATSDEQCAVAGLLGASSAVAFMLAPLLGTALYQVAPVAPYGLGVAALMAVGAFTFLDPTMRAPSPAPERGRRSSTVSGQQ